MRLIPNRSQSFSIIFTNTRSSKSKFTRNLFFPQGEGHSLICHIRGRAAGQGIWFLASLSEQGIQLYANLASKGSERVLNRVCFFFLKKSF